MFTKYTHELKRLSNFTTISQDIPDIFVGGSKENGRSVVVESLVGQRIYLPNLYYKNSKIITRLRNKQDRGFYLSSDKVYTKPTMQSYNDFHLITYGYPGCIDVNITEVCDSGDTYIKVKNHTFKINTGSPDSHYIRDYEEGKVFLDYVDELLTQELRAAVLDSVINTISEGLTSLSITESDALCHAHVINTITNRVLQTQVVQPDMDTKVSTGFIMDRILSMYKLLTSKKQPTVLEHMLNNIGLYGNVSGFVEALQKDYTYYNDSINEGFERLKIEIDRILLKEKVIYGCSPFIIGNIQIPHNLFIDIDTAKIEKNINELVQLVEEFEDV